MEFGFSQNLKNKIKNNFKKNIAKEQMKRIDECDFKITINREESIQIYIFSNSIMSEFSNKYLSSNFKNFLWPKSPTI